MMTARIWQLHQQILSKRANISLIATKKNNRSSSNINWDNIMMAAGMNGIHFANAKKFHSMEIDRVTRKQLEAVEKLKINIISECLLPKSGNNIQGRPKPMDDWLQKTSQGSKHCCNILLLQSCKNVACKLQQKKRSSFIAFCSSPLAMLCGIPSLILLTKLPSA